MKSRKVLDIRDNGTHLICIRIDGDRNPYRVYTVSNGHRRQIAKYGDWMSVIFFLKDFYMDGADAMTTPERMEWARKRGMIRR